MTIESVTPHEAMSGWKMHGVYGAPNEGEDLIEFCCQQHSS